MMKQTSKTKPLSKRKQELYQRSTQFRSALTSDLNDMKIDVERWGKNFLIVGGSLYMVYKLLKLFKGSEEISPAEDNPQAIVVTKESSAIVSKIKEQIALFLLAIAFKKLKEFIKDTPDDEAHS